MAKRRRSIAKLPSGWKAVKVSPTMRKPCTACGGTPRLIRIEHTIDSYPFPTQECLCAVCAVISMRKDAKAMAQRIEEFAERAEAEGWT